MLLAVAACLNDIIATSRLAARAIHLRFSSQELGKATSAANKVSESVRVPFSCTQQFCSGSCMMADTIEASKPVIVGYAFRPKRLQTLITPELLSHAKASGITLQKVDVDRTLVEQGPFDMLLHKLQGDSWEKELADYQSKFPETCIVDDYEAVHRLDDRRGMLQVVKDLDPSRMHGAKVETPCELIIEAGTSPGDIVQLLNKNSFELPAVAKPLEANGTTNSHSLALVLTEKALEKLEPPVLLQSFVNHGGILFKLYVLGDKVMVFRRQSLPDITPPSPTNEDGTGEQGEDLVEFNRISNVHLSEEELQDSRVTDPPPPFMRAMGLNLRDLLRLKAFNVDILREGGHGDRYFIVDINYMPGYERIPDFHTFFVDFIRKSVLAKRSSGLSTAVPAAPSLSADLPKTPYPVLPAKKKWVYFRAAMKLCGLHHRVSSDSKRLDADDIPQADA